jgi:phosphoserine phosphatase
MTKHPLTDEMCLELSAFTLDIMAEDWAEWHREDMRAAADWQLGQVIEWIKECPNYDLDFHSECRRMIADLKQAMRPQQQEDN